MKRLRWLAIPASLGTLRLSLDQSTTRIGAPAAWQVGFTGRGVRVAVLDSGVDTSHPDFTGSGPPS